MLNLTDVKKLANLARLEVSDEELETLLHDLTATLAYIDQVTNANIPAEDDQVGSNYNVVRDDVVTTTSGQYTDLLLEQAVGVQDNFVKVKKIL